MAKTSTPSFVLTLRLETDNLVLDKRFNIAHHIYNVMVKHARCALAQLEQDKQYKNIMSTYHKTKRFAKGDKQRLNELRMYYGLSEYQFHDYIKKQNHLFSKHMDINTIQKIGSTVWKSVSQYIFKNGKRVSYKKRDSLNSVEGKTNASGIRFTKNCIYWKGIVAPVHIRKRDNYAKECISTYPVKYCRIIRKWHKHEYRYYAQLVLQGLPPQKHQYNVNDTRVVGIDPGTSTMAVVSNDTIIFTELAHNVMKIEKTIKRLNKKSDRQRRFNNPLNYNDNGTIKRNSKTFCRSWIISKRHRITQDKLKTLYTKRAAMLRYEHNKLANQILEQCGTNIYSEQMNYAALQKRAIKTEVSKKTGMLKRKKRFGKSLSNHAPSMFLAILNTKLSYINKAICFVDTRKTKLSKLNHQTGEYEDVSLNQRWKTVCNKHIQRDLYSAFLLMNMENPETVSIAQCNKNFHNFIRLHDDCMSRLTKEKQEGKRIPSCMGI